jgi:hypothetical protein
LRIPQVFAEALGRVLQGEPLPPRLHGLGDLLGGGLWVAGRSRCRG